MQATLQLDPQYINLKIAEEVQKIALEQIREIASIQRICIDIKQMAEITSLSTRTLERHVINDPRIKQHELRFCSKRLWDYQGFKNEFLEIAKANDFTQL